MASRDERMQQRLRGAQRREIGEVDFGLKIPVTSKVQIPTANQQSQVQSQLPQLLELEQPFYTHRTPENRSFTTNVKNVSKISSKQALSTASSANANTSKKRRRLDKDLAVSTTTINTSTSPNKDKYSTIYSDDELSTRVNISDISNVSVEKDSLKVTQNPYPYAIQSPQRSGRKSQVLDEVSESPVGAPGSGQRIRLEDRSPTISQLDEAQSGALSQSINYRPASKKKKRKKATTDGESRERSSSLFVRDERNQDSQIGDDNRGALNDDNENNKITDNYNENEDCELDELSPEISCRNRQNAVENTLESDKSSIDEINPQEPDRFLNINKGVINDQEQTRKPREYSPDLDLPLITHNNKKRKRQGRKITTRIQKSGILKSKLESHPSKKAAPSKIQSRNSIPVIVHRLSAPKNNETALINSKFLKEDIRCKTRISINFIDVLDQVSQGVVESKLSRLKEQRNRCNSEKSRKDYNIKVRAVKAYGQDLQTRLLEYTCDLDNSYLLESRLRDEKKKRLYLREELLRTRVERDQIALRMDEVRIKHEKSRDEDMRKDTLNNTLHKVELAIDMARGNISNTADKKPDIRSIEFLLKKLAQEVSTKSSSGGILRHVKEFNEFLERAAVALEKRPI